MQNQGLIVRNSLLAGMSVLVPLPVLDDLAKNYFRKKLAVELGRKYGVSLDAKALNALVVDPFKWSMHGCLFIVLVYPVKKIFRKIFYFMEIKRAIDETSSTYHSAYLWNYAFKHAYVPQSGCPVERAGVIRKAVFIACKKITVKPIERAIGSTFNHFSGTLRTWSKEMKRVLSRKKENFNDATTFIEQSSPIDDIKSDLQQRLQAIPEENYRVLVTHFEAALNLPLGLVNPR